MLAAKDGPYHSTGSSKSWVSEFVSSLWLSRCLADFLLVNDNTHPLAVSDWGPRRDAIKQILRMACIHLGYLNAPPVVLMHIVLDDSDEEEIKELPSLYRAPESSQGPILARASSPAEVRPSASADTSLDISSRCESLSLPISTSRRHSRCVLY